MHFQNSKTLCILAAALAILASRNASASTMFGSLSNFDVINDTGEVCHGFEIELEGVHSQDIYSTFGAPYIRYGDPTVVSTATGVIIRYASSFNGTDWAAGTPIPAGPITTGGHALFYPAYGGDPSYETIGGEHFGIALNGNPISTTYRWLLGDTLGNLSPAGTNVKIPAPVWTITPPAAPGAPVAVKAVIQAPEKENPLAEFGDAIWVKVFVTESADPAELNNLQFGNPAVPDGSDAAEVEIEWELLQAGNVEQLDSGDKNVGAGHESVTRRYEFYEYIGGYDPENHEALVDNAVQHPDAIGGFLGAQNAAANLIPFVIPVPEPGTIVLLGLGTAVCLRRVRGAGPRFI